MINTPRQLCATHQGTEICKYRLYTRTYASRQKKRQPTVPLEVVGVLEASQERGLCMLRCLCYRRCRAMRPDPDAGDPVFSFL